jgi:hypothetical protein
MQFSSVQFSSRKLEDSRIHQEDVVQGNSVVDVFSVGGPCRAYIRSSEDCERICQEDVVQGSSVVDVFSAGGPCRSYIRISEDCSRGFFRKTSFNAVQ